MTWVRVSWYLRSFRLLKRLRRVWSSESLSLNFLLGKGDLPVNLAVNSVNQGSVGDSEGGVC